MEKFEFGPIQTKWLESLEQHPERQLKEALGKKYSDGSYKACCLGELGLIAGICEFDNNDNNLYTIYHAYSSSGVLSSVHDKVGLHDSAGSPINGGGSDLFALTTLNDNKCTWPEIAAIVRANPTAYFSKSV